MLSRRALIAGAAASAALLPGRAFAYGRCVNHTDTLRECEVGLELGIDIARQRCNSWCWAACIEAVFAMHGYQVPQEDVVAKIFGGGSPTENCEGANEGIIVAAVDGKWYDISGRPFRAQARILPLGWMGVRTPERTTLGVDLTDPTATALAMTEDMFSSNDLRVMLNELVNENPLIVVSGDPQVMAHACVLTGVTFFESASGNIALTQLVVRDPWPDSPNRRIYSADEVNGTFSVIKVSVA